MAAETRHVEDPELTEACGALVEEEGGREFFRVAGWRARLRDRVAAFRARRSDRGRWESREEGERRITEDLLEAKELLEGCLHKERIEHLCCPWGVGSATSVRVSKEVGYRSNFWNRTRDGYRNRPGHDPFQISRVGEDFLALLQVAGQSTLGSLVRMKLRRRVGTGSPYLSH